MIKIIERWEILFLLALLASFTCADYRLDQITHEPVPEGEKVAPEMPDRFPFDECGRTIDE